MSRSELLRETMKERIVLFDGAMGTMIQSKNLTPEDFGGVHLDGCNENLVLTQPSIIESIHRAYFEAGSDIVETNTFGGTPLVLAEYGLADKALEINRAAAQIARRAADALSTSNKPRFVAGSMGPTTKTITVTGGVTFDELTDNFAVQAQGLIEGGVDVLLLETRARYAKPESRHYRTPAGAEKTWLELAHYGQRHHRTHGRNAGRAGRRGALHIPRTR